MWRDQWIFVGDEGTVAALGLQRTGSGDGEAKGWLAEDGALAMTFYRRFGLARGDANDRAAALSALARAPGVGARIALEESNGGLVLTLRAPNRTLVLACDGLEPLGEASDPEGVSIYSAGRARLRVGSRREPGWLVTEGTDADRPRRAFVDYGSFVFAVLTTADRVVVVKHSNGARAFDHAFLRDGRGTHETADVRTELTAERLEVRLPEVSLEATASIGAHEATVGVAPGGARMRYEVLLLEGEWSGLAFGISPEEGSGTR